MVYSAPPRVPIDEEPPEPMAYLWQWFTDLSMSRTGNGYGANPIQPSEIISWAIGMNVALTPWEFGTLRRMEAAVVSVLNRKRDSEDSHTEVPASDAKAVSTLFAGLKQRAARAFG